MVPSGLSDQVPASNEGSPVASCATKVSFSISTDSASLAKYWKLETPPSPPRRPPMIPGSKLVGSV